MPPTTSSATAPPIAAPMIVDGDTPAIASSIVDVIDADIDADDGDCDVGGGDEVDVLIETARSLVFIVAILTLDNVDSVTLAAATVAVGVVVVIRDASAGIDVVVVVAFVVAVVVGSRHARQFTIVDK
jgi:hypothetical protein